MMIGKLFIRLLVPGRGHRKWAAVSHSIRSVTMRWCFVHGILSVGASFIHPRLDTIKSRARSTLIIFENFQVAASTYIGMLRSVHYKQDGWKSKFKKKTKFKMADISESLPYSTEYCGNMSEIFPIFHCNWNIAATFLSIIPKYFIATLQF